MVRWLWVSVAAAACFGCAMTYEQPGAGVQRVSVEHGSTAAEVLRLAKRALVMEGYRVQSYDDGAGLISTSMKDVKLDPLEADCGKTMGLDYLKDSRTKTTVAVNVIVDDVRLHVSAVVQGEYKPGDVSQDMTLQCVSKGVIERSLASRIVNQ